MPATRARTVDVGTPGVVSRDGWLDGFEDTPELRFPLSATVFDKMRRDAQVDAVLRAAMLPIRRTPRRLIGDDVRPEVLRFCEVELGLNDPETGRRRRRRQGVSFPEVLRHALLMLPFGFMPLVPLYDVGPPAPGAPVNRALVAHLRRLGPRMPRSLTGIDVADDGGLIGIRQSVTRANGVTETVRIGVDDLVMFVNDREGGEWTGRSVLRSSYGHWLIKQRLMRLGPVIVERNGMGIPVVHYPDGGDRALALDIARKFRAGEEAGVALPHDWTLELVAVTGATRDELPLLKWHDEAMGRAALAMFLNLGHDRGSQSLGDTFADYFVLSIGAILEELAETFTEHVIRDLVELTFGEDEPYPELKFDEVNADSTPTAEGLKALADSGLLGPIDPDLTAEVRRRYGLPKSAAMADVEPGQTAPDLEPVEDVPGIAGLVDRAERVATRLAALAARSAA